MRVRTSQLDLTHVMVVLLGVLLGQGQVLRDVTAHQVALAVARHIDLNLKLMLRKRMIFHVIQLLG